MTTAVTAANQSDIVEPIEMPIHENALRELLQRNPLWAYLAKHKEVPILAAVLAEGEGIIDVGFGLYEEHLGLVAATTQRVVFAGRKPASLLKHTKTEVFDYTKISSVQVNGSKTFSTLVVVVSSARGEIKSMASPVCQRLADVIRAKIGVAQSPAPTTITTKATSGFVEELAQLASLHSSGALSDEEFVTAKRKLLG